jgi:hypothetical protein
MKHLLPSSQYWLQLQVGQDTSFRVKNVVLGQHKNASELVLFRHGDHDMHGFSLAQPRISGNIPLLIGCQRNTFFHKLSVSGEST